MTNLSDDELVAGLEVGARGIYPQEAAVALLVGHGQWLRRADFVSQCVDVVERSEESSGPMAFVDWRAALAADLPSSASERQVLELAAELAGEDSGDPLGDLVTGLDEVNLGLVVQAFVYANRGPRGLSGALVAARRTPGARRGLRANPLDS